MNSFADARTRPVEWVIEEIIPRNTVTLISATSGFGKSMIGIHMALSILSGKPWMGFSVAQSGIAYWDQDNPDKVLSENRIVAVAKGLGLTEIPRTPASHLFRLRNSIIDNPQERDALIANLHEAGISVLFVDTLAAVAPRAESGVDEATKLIVETLFAIVDSGITVILFHHMAKEQLFQVGRTVKAHQKKGVNAARGSSALPASCGAVYNLEKDDLGLVSMTCAKPRYGHPPKLKIKYDEDGEMGDPSWIVTLEPAELRISLTHLSQHLKRPEHAHLRNLTSRQLVKALSLEGILVSQSTAARALKLAESESGTTPL